MITKVLSERDVQAIERMRKIARDHDLPWNTQFLEMVTLVNESVPDLIHTVRELRAALAEQATMTEQLLTVCADHTAMQERERILGLLDWSAWVRHHREVRSLPLPSQEK